MKQLKQVSLLLGLLILVFYSCTETGINEPVIQLYGVQGVVRDTTGKPLNNVNVYCLFAYDYIPYNSSMPKQVFNIAGVDSFSFNLYQNFPSPVYNSSFIRFSLPSDMDIELTLKEKVSGTTKYILSGSYSSGFYQHYLNEFVSGSQIENGCYLIELKASKNGNQEYEKEKELFVVSDVGKPNSTTNHQGIYSFEYEKACIGDTIVSTFDGTYTNLIPVRNRINLLFKKDGYKSQIMNVTLYPGVLLNTDVILQEEE